MSSPVPWHPGAITDEEKRAFLQRRIIEYTRVTLIVFVVLIIVVSAAQFAYPELQPQRSKLLVLAGVVGIFPMFLAWWFVTRDGRSIRSLYTADAAVALFMGFYLASAAYLIPDRAPNIYLPFIFVTLSVFGRVLIVPSRGVRTFVLSCLNVGPLLIAYGALAAFAPEHLDVPPAVFLIGASALSFVLIGMAWVGADIMYGLRLEVVEASKLGQYTLDQRLGEGAMGEVYRASHAMLRRPTAIKLLKLDGASERGRTRFEREVQLTSQLTHPNIIAIYDYGTTPDGRFYYAMEYLEGVDLQKLVALRGPLTANRIIHVLEQVCSALAEAHDRGLIHRDIKPANIMLCRRGDRRDFVKVLDFGLVKDLEEKTDLTGPLLTGTPAFMAPEMITEPDAVSPASDLYCLGATAFFLATGKLVFEGNTIAEVCVHHVDTPPPSLAERGAPNPIPAELDALVTRCLAKDPSARPASARAMAQTLRRMAQAHPWTEEDAEAWWREIGGTNLRTKATTGSFSPATMTVDLHDRALGSDRS